MDRREASLPGRDEPAEYFDLPLSEDSPPDNVLGNLDSDERAKRWANTFNQSDGFIATPLDPVDAVSIVRVPPILPEGTGPLKTTRPARLFWRPQRDLNPCCSLERAES